ncbi:PRC-barrel domain-containing protein [Tropicibacter naphthalenivorans]|uniref:PRC-barrel domain protein n=1 Tax=Tropicibacter naphthalenivorans TaxID=441103 RepID=A0A0P1GNE8_9RHOB|nr:PRC-barrel domain-containing protein [Tropicibacter naphthalenivorans]CUH76844.1 PRC-barrel domain protein [Tropicibacter naphthalenivorans]SMC62674.1 PRC-barrel domain-containing protein [Tropicibacter naphthalenivorans]
MNRFMMTAAAAALIPVVALAESHAATDGMMKMDQTDEAEMRPAQPEVDDMAAADMDMGSDPKLIRTRDITGGTVYTMTESTDAVADWGNMMFDSVDDSWDAVGEIEDIVLAADGSFKGIVAEVGGFLDIGDKHVMIPVSNAMLVPVDDASYSIVVSYTLEELKAMEGVDEGFWN